MKHLTFTEKDNVYLTADTHFCHRRNFIYEARGYSTPEDHTQGIINKINEMVGENDYLFNLGDFVLNASRENFEELISKIKCQNIYYLNGNHNSRILEAYDETVCKYLNINGSREKAIDVYPLRYKNIIFVGNYLEITVNKQFIVLSHYPLSSWNKMSHGSWHCFGHVHSKIDTTLGKSMDVGIDLHGRPISFYELKALMDAKPIKNEGHHISN